MPKQKSRTQPIPRDAHQDAPRDEEISPPSEREQSARGRADMREAADFLMEDEESVADILARAGVPVMREDAVAYVSRRDLRQYRERVLAARRAGVREITRLSIEAGLDDLDYARLHDDHP